MQPQKDAIVISIYTASIEKHRKAKERMENIDPVKPNGFLTGKNVEYLVQVNVDKRAEILQDTFRHYYSMAMDHHTKAGTTSNMLLIIVGAIISLFGLDNTGSGTPRLVGGLAVFVIGLFGVVWVLKQHERYHFWEHIAYEYQKELTNIVPALNIGSTYFDSAREATTKEFGAFFAKMYERYLWVALHGMVALIGLSLMVFAI